MKLNGDRVLIEIAEAVTKTAFGFLLDPKTPPEGTVLVTGPGVKILKEGDRIRHYPFCGTPIEYEGKKCLILKEDGEVDLIL